MTWLLLLSGFLLGFGGGYALGLHRSEDVLSKSRRTMNPVHESNSLGTGGLPNFVTAAPEENTSSGSRVVRTDDSFVGRELRNIEAFSLESDSDLLVWLDRRTVACWLPAAQAGQGEIQLRQARLTWLSLTAKGINRRTLSEILPLWGNGGPIALVHLDDLLMVAVDGGGTFEVFRDQRESIYLSSLREESSAEFRVETGLAVELRLGGEQVYRVGIVAAT